VTDLGYERYEAEFGEQTRRLGAALAGAPADLPVPTCPEWTLRDLVSHVGSGHRWSAGVVARGTQPPTGLSLFPAPDEPARWADWLSEGADSLISAVRAAGPDCPVWTWQADRSAGFWVRRMLHDEVIHRFDVELARGQPGDLPTDLAVDGVTDMFHTFATLSVPGVADEGMGRLAGGGQSLHFHATDAAGEWWAQRTPAGLIWRAEHRRGDVAVRGPARELLLLLNRRVPPDAGGFEIFGDRAVLDDFLEFSRF
jgi:uncharacterized protein (TIGR03083 family)